MRNNHRSINVIRVLTVVLILTGLWFGSHSPAPIAAQRPDVKGPFVSTPVMPASFDGVVRQLPQRAPREQPVQLMRLRTLPDEQPNSAPSNAPDAAR